MQPLTTRPTRPARPAVIDPETLADGVRSFGMKPREIADLQYIKAGLVLTDLLGNRTIHVRVPDALGRTGLMWYPTPGHEAPKSLGMPVFADMDDPTRTSGAVTGDPWTAEDLLFAATRLQAPDNLAHMRPWVNAAETSDDRAFRACRFLIQLGKRAGSLQAAVETTAGGRDLLQAIASTDLLGPGECDRLAVWRGPIPGDRETDPNYYRKAPLPRAPQVVPAVSGE